MIKELKLLEKLIFTIKDDLELNKFQLLSIDSNIYYYFRELNENKLVFSISLGFLRSPEFDIGYSADISNDLVTNFENRAFRHEKKIPYSAMLSYDFGIGLESNLRKPMRKPAEFNIHSDFLLQQLPKIIDWSNNYNTLDQVDKEINAGKNIEYSLLNLFKNLYGITTALLCKNPQINQIIDLRIQNINKNIEFYNDNYDLNKFFKNLVENNLISNELCLNFLSKLAQ